MFKTDFPVMDEVKLTGYGGAPIHNCPLKPLSILIKYGLHHNFSAYFSKYMFEVKNLKKVQRSDWNFKEFPAPGMSTF